MLETWKEERNLEGNIKMEGSKTHCEDMNCKRGQWRASYCTY
jgi:hypothetical protein